MTYNNAMMIVTCILQPRFVTKKLMGIVVCLLVSTAFADEAKAQKIYSEESELTTPLQREMATLYTEALRQRLESDASIEEKNNFIQGQIDVTARCVVQRSILANKADDQTEMRSYEEESDMLMAQYQYIAFALERNKLANANNIIHQLVDNKSILEQEIQGVFDRNANSGSNQATDEIYQLAIMCRDAISNVRAFIYEASDRLK